MQCGLCCFSPALGTSERSRGVPDRVSLGEQSQGGSGEGLQGPSCAHLVRDLVRAVLLLLLWAIGGEAARLTDGVSSVTSVVSGSGGCVVTGRAAYVYISSAMFVDTGLAVFGDRGLLSTSMFSGNGERVVSLIPNVETRPRPPGSGPVGGATT